MGMQQEKWESVPFMNALNSALQDASLKLSLKAGLLVLDADKDLLSYISCQGPDLVLMAEGSQQMKNLNQPNVLLGSQANPVFMETVDNWRPGDTLWIHTMKLERPVGDARLLSAQHQAEKLLESVGSIKKMSLAVCLRRVF